MYRGVYQFGFYFQNDMHVSRYNRQIMTWEYNKIKSYI